jgi:hypothetical protein
MDRELREVHARMREAEMRKREGAQVAPPPRYADLQKDGMTGTGHETSKFRASGDAR